MKPIYIFGHRNPDNDSIASATAYAYLKNATDPENSYVPARLGDVPPETVWVFERYGVELPKPIKHIHTRVEDVMKTDVVTTRTTQTMKEAGRMMRDSDMRALPVLDDHDKVVGLLTHKVLALRYLHEIVDFGAKCDGTLCKTRVLKVENLMETGLEFSRPDRLLADAAEDLFASSDRELVVTDSDGHCVGILTRTDIARGGKRRCILVDHNEMSQSAPGIEDANVVEIIDHHRVGDVQSAGPILFYNMPVGSTATIVAIRYRELDVEIPKEMAAILLSALLTDTVMLKSPTATETDVRYATILAEIAGVNYQEFGIDILRNKMANTPFDPRRILTSDLKEYRVGDSSIAIVQYETITSSDVKENRSEIVSTMQEILGDRSYDAFIFMATDIVREGSEIFAVGDTRIAQRALDVDFINNSVWMPGVLSRKKQIAARFLGLT